MPFPLLVEQLALEGLAIIEIDILRQSSPVEEAIAEGSLDVLAVLGKGKRGTHRVSGCPVEDHDHGHALCFPGLGIEDIEGQSVPIGYPNFAHAQ